MELLSSWPLWLAVVAIITIGYFLVAKPTKVKSPQGKHFSNPIHTQPLFKVASILVLAFVLFWTIPILIAQFNF